MNAFRLSSRRKNLRFLLLLGGWNFIALAPGLADPDPSSANEALATAKNWVAEIDAGKYEESYAEGCTALHNKVTHDQWITVLKAIRPALGDVVSRKEDSHSYKPDGYEGLDGECMVIKYDTSLTKMPSLIEVVVLKREDGKWRGAGYNAQPQTAPEGDIPPPQASTTTTSEESNPSSK
jgi:hypothetical protein